MTEKRYNYSELKDGTYGIFKDKYYDDNTISFSMRLCEVQNEEQARSIVGQLSGLVEENMWLKEEKDGLFDYFMNHYERLDDEVIEIEYDLSERIKELEKENEQLKERNNRQRKQLETLWELISKKDYDTLSNMYQEIIETEELLEKEAEAKSMYIKYSD